MTTNVVLAGLESVLPAWSVARTVNVWVPSASGRSVNADVQGTSWPVSIRQVKVEPISSARNAIVGEASSVAGGGLDVIVVSGGVESSRYEIELEHPDVLPATSVAVAAIVVVVLSATLTGRPGAANAAALPIAAATPPQFGTANTRTVDPASAAPMMYGRLSFAGDSGSVPARAGGRGAVCRS